MRKVLCYICLLFVLGLFFIGYKINQLKNVEYFEPAILKNKKILTVYYSRSGHTDYISGIISNLTRSDIVQIELKNPYSLQPNLMLKEIRNQLREGELPEIKEINIDDYDVIFLGSPVWNFSIALPVESFLAYHNFDGKIIIPFVTYEGGARGKKINKEISKYTKDAVILKPLMVYREGFGLGVSCTISWLNKLSFHQSFF